MPQAKTSSALLTDYLTHARLVRQFSDHTLSEYQRDISAFIQFTKSDKDNDFADLSTRICRQYITHLKNEHNNNTRTIARKVAALRSFWRYLLAEDIVTDLPWDSIRVCIKDERLPTVLSVEDILRFLDSIPTGTTAGLRDRAIFELLYTTGLRVSELTSLNVDDILLEDMLITVVGKGNKERVVIFAELTRDLLHAYIQTSRWALLSKKKNTTALFLNTNGGRLTPRSVQRILKSYAEPLGLDDALTPHALRHAFASHIYNAGGDLRSIQRLLGHENISTTQIYAKLSTEKLAESLGQFHPDK